MPFKFSQINSVISKLFFNKYLIFGYRPIVSQRFLYKNIIYCLNQNFVIFLVCKFGLPRHVITEQATELTVNIHKLGKSLSGDASKPFLLF